MMMRRVKRKSIVMMRRIRMNMARKKTIVASGLMMKWIRKRKNGKL